LPLFVEPFSYSGRRRLIMATALLGAPTAFFLLLRMLPGLDVLFMSVNFHLLVVGGISACALGVALLSAGVAARARDGSLVFLALGCLGLGVTMLGHGLTTPGVAGMPMNLWVGRLPDLAVFLFALGLVAALIRPESAATRFVAEHSLLFVAVPAVALTAGLVFIVSNPEAGPGSTPLPSEGMILNIIAGATGAVLVVTGIVHWRRWRLGNDRIQLALAFASWMGAQAEVSLHYGRFWQLSWWDYHAVLLAGFGAAVYAIVASSSRHKDQLPGLAGTFKNDPLAHIERGYPEVLKALVAATEAKDSYTRGHSRRVTELSVKLGQRLGLSADALRRLAWGAELHDIGKIGIPDSILNKEGALSPDERKQVELHPVIGWEIASQTRSLEEILDVIRSHHERVDGRGYPDGLAGDDIPLAARVVSVIDVWDAVTSDRSYRPAWSLDKALAIMVEGRGTQFDARCLDTFLEFLEEQGVTRRAAAHRAS
jgi:HD-GYP domain-containing protein (c-di-GMP phosphodiesterase class II)